MKVGDRVKRITAGNGLLRIGNVYTVKSIDGSNIRLIGETGVYHKEYFSLCKDELITNKVII